MFHQIVVFDTLSQKAIASFQVKGKLEKRAPTAHASALPLLFLLLVCWAVNSQED